ncbi:MAG TPA: LysM domain-containing protein, partial [Egibacteraceae bacterium]|nr:LysM domain-containing protein [Egibacteraceae bacterium]
PTDTDEEADPREGWTTYTVKSGDTLISIAQDVYGDGTKFNLIADANGIDKNNKLRVGQELQIPPAD